MIYRYDNKGNVIVDSTTAKDTLGYDQLNRLVSFSGTTEEQYYYDGEGKRIRKYYAGDQIVFLYDQWGNLIGERDIEGNFVCDYVWANGKLVAKIVLEGEVEPTGGEGEGMELEGGGPPPIPPDTTEKVYYYHLDHLGAPLVLTEINRQLHWGTNYLPFGKTYGETSVSVSNEVRLPGQYHDRNTKLYYNWHRYYNPSLGRYYQADPKGLFGGMNLYTYVDNNPQRWVDPNGLQIFWPGSYGYPIYDKNCGERVARESYLQSLSSGLEGMDVDHTPWNAYLHCLWNCEMTQQCGWSTALLAGTGHELWDKGTVPYFIDIWASRMDLHNNAKGRDCARKIFLNDQKCKYTDCDRCCREKLNSNELIVLQK